MAGVREVCAQAWGLLSAGVRPPGEVVFWAQQGPRELGNALLQPIVTGCHWGPRAGLTWPSLVLTWVWSF